MSYLDDAYAALIAWEQLCTWMYLDTKDIPTTAVGEAMLDVATACSFPWMAAGGGPASLTEIKAELMRVRSMPAGHLATFYRTPQSLTLTEEWCRARLAKRVYGYEIDLRTLIPKYDALPDTAKVALIDMEHNLGPGRLLPTPTGIRQYTGMLAAIKAGNFQKAALECGRNVNNAAFDMRNTWTRRQFALAARAAMVISPPQGAKAT